MENRTNILNNYFAKSTINGTISINDLREKEFNGELLSAKEKQALVNYDRFRISVLNAQFVLLLVVFLKLLLQSKRPLQHYLN